MNAVIWIIVIITSIWVYLHARKIGIKKISQGKSTMNMDSSVGLFARCCFANNVSALSHKTTRLKKKFQDGV